MNKVIKTVCISDVKWMVSEYRASSILRYKRLHYSIVDLSIIFELDIFRYSLALPKS